MLGPYRVPMTLNTQKPVPCTLETTPAQGQAPGHVGTFRACWAREPWLVELADWGLPRGFWVLLTCSFLPLCPPSSV